VLGSGSGGGRMTTGTLIAIDLVVAVLAAGGWLAAGAVAATGRRGIAFALGCGALAATFGRLFTTWLLAEAGWWFAAEKVLIAGPLTLAAIVVAAPGLARPAGDSRKATVRFLCAGYAVTAALLVTVVHGYPAGIGTALLATGGVAAATAVTWRPSVAAAQPTVRGPERTVSRVAGWVAVVAVTAGAGFAVAPGAAPAVHEGHVAPGAAGVGEPAKRFALTAGTAVVPEGKVWAFDGQVPGPQLTATVGDLIEVRLRNRDIERGVTLHWHGYDVPNDQDGVPGVTQGVVRPGQEHVYRFRAEQAGTYWYHTHSASDIGVRMGLYGVLLVNPRPGADVVIPVHTLNGTLLPHPAVETVRAGRQVRLRLINTDSTTHRFALAGTPFRVVAIDGMDLNEPGPLNGTAVLIPAGGRYDLEFTAPATPVGLFVGGRLTWSTGPTVAGTARWPVLDPLGYGVAEPVPWAGFDQDLTLVLDRGIDLSGLLPRYAHTVNGAADPDIPAQVVRRGETVRFTIVNRSLAVHPWHLHGYHVLVLSRNGRPVRGSPLWLDSFDVRPGEVWQVAFRAGNPGMWAKHCHNLPHADQGMMVHLMVT
jgi:FtsP/CotA-like multicopper oxidase with cupredoxin domain